MPRALLLAGDAAEELDTMYPYYRVQEGGWDVDVSSRTMRPIQLVGIQHGRTGDARKGVVPPAGGLVQNQFVLSITIQVGDRRIAGAIPLDGLDGDFEVIR